MKTVFVSAASADLRGAREAVTAALVEAGILPKVQEHLPPDHRTLEDALTAAIESCDAVVCIVGHAFGAAPPTQEGDERRSYTQREYDVAMALGKPVFVLLAEHGFEPDAPVRETETDRSLQARHRERLLAAHKCEWFSDIPRLLGRVSSIVTRIRALEPPVELRLRIPQPESDLDRQPSKLLLAHNRFLRLLGRESEIALLESFRDAPRTFGWIVVSGVGGVGKTRLGLEFARLSERAGWHAGFLDASELARFERSGLADWRPGRDTLIVVDYAGGKARALSPLFERCARIALESTGEAGARLRLVLLEREASDERGSWLDSLIQTGEGDVRAAIRSANQGVMPLGAPVSGSGPEHGMTEAVLRASLAAWEASTGRSAPAFPEFNEADWYLIRRNTMNRPLYLQMAAVSACEAGDARHLPTWVRGDLLRAAVSRERDYIERACHSEEGLAEVLERLSALLCLTGVGVRRSGDWISIIRDEIDSIGWDGLKPRHVDQRLSTLFTALDTLGDDDTPVSPDILAGAFAASVLLGHPAGSGSELQKAVDIGSISAWLKLIRLVQDLHGVEGFEGVGMWLDRLVENRPYEELLIVSRQVPERTQALRRFAGRLYEHLARMSESLERPPGERIWTLIRWSAHLDGTGDPASQKRALEIARQAVAAADALAEDGSVEHRALQATAYHYLARCLDSLGRSEELAAVERAVELREALADENWAEFGAELGKSLNNLSNALSAWGDPEEALSVIRRSAKIAESLATEAWDQHAPEVARTQNNLARRLLAVDRPEEALPHAERSVSIRRDLVRRWPDEFHTDYNLSLGTLSAVHAALGDFDEAFRVFRRESRNRVRLLRALAVREPVEYGPRLTEELDRVTEARWTYLGRKPPLEPSDLNVVPAMVQGREDRAIDLARREAFSEAEALLIDVVASWRAMSERGSDRVLHLARALNNLAAVREMDGDSRAALPVIEEALELLEPRTAADPVARHEMARVLDTSARIERGLGRRDRALERAERSDGLFAQLREEYRDDGTASAGVLVREHAEIRLTLADLLRVGGDPSGAARVLAAAIVDLLPMLETEAPGVVRVVRELLDGVSGLRVEHPDVDDVLSGSGVDVEAIERMLGGS